MTVLLTNIFTKWTILSIQLLYISCLNTKLLNNEFKECGKREFSCTNSICIPLQWTCDGEFDCQDKSDESTILCAKALNTTCSKEEFKCDDGTCIPLRWQCDKEKDCPNGSDEDHHTCQQKVCSADEFTCTSAPSECVPLILICDDKPDCSDGSDEKSCNKTRYHMFNHEDPGIPA